MTLSKDASRLLTRVVGLTSALALAATMSGCASSSTPSPTPIAGQSTTSTSVASDLPSSTSPSATPTSTPLDTSPTAPTVPTTAVPTTAVAPAAAFPHTDELKVRELQVRLAQLNWYDAKINGSYDGVTQSAVAGYQAKRGLPSTGEIDQATWTSLLSRTDQPTHDAMYNILRPGPTLLGAGATGDQVRDLQARLKQIGWWTGDVLETYGPNTTEAVKGFQAKRGFPVTGNVDQRTLDALRAMTRQPTSDEMHNIAPKPVNNAPAATSLDPRCLTPGKVICVSKTTSQLVFVVDGKPQFSMSARFGRPGMETREGVFSVYFKTTMAKGVDESDMPYSLFFSGGQAVHYSANFARVGYNWGSHGCVNVRNMEKLQALYAAAPVGTKVVIYW